MDEGDSLFYHQNAFPLNSHNLKSVFRAGIKKPSETLVYISKFIQFYRKENYDYASKVFLTQMPYE